MQHVPVLLTEVLTALNPASGETYIDATFGAGGYSRKVLAAADCHLVGLDRDPNVAPHVDAMRAEFGERFTFVRTAFSDMVAAMDGQKVHGVVLDIGVSSMQLDQSERGFSFMRDGPLDMRMSGEGPSAADAVNQLPHGDLIQIFKAYGEERRARRCADFIVRAREQAPLTTTLALADVITSALGRSGKTHPATRVFQALRIYINDELGELYKALLAAEAILLPGGRLVVVSFHSLEDRIVKTFFRARSGERAGGSRYAPPLAPSENKASFKVTKRSSISAGKDELASNPRARSARLRSGVRTAAPVWPPEEVKPERFANLDALQAMCT